MNILYICADPGIPIHGDKGAAIHVRVMIAALRRQGHSVTLLTPRIDGDQPVEGTVFHVPLPAGDKSLLAEQRKESRCLAYRTVLLEKAKTLLAEQDYQFIYERYSLWSDVGAQLHKATQLPFVLEVNSPLRKEALSYRSLHNDAQAAQIEAVQFQSATLISVVSQPLATYVVDKGAKHDAVRVLPNAVDPMNFHPGVRGHKLGLRDKKVIGFVGRIRPWHDVPTLLAALRILHQQDPAYHLILVGRGSEDLSIPPDLTSAVTCFGAVPHVAVPGYVAAMDVAVSPHINDHNSWFSPLKVFEYLACGVPTAAANVGQAGQLLQENEIGWVFEPENPHALADCIANIFDDQPQAKQTAWQGAEFVLKQFTWDYNAAVICALGNPIATSTQPLPIFDAKLRQRLFRATRPDLALDLMPHKIQKCWTQIKQVEVLKYKVKRRAVLAYQSNTGERIIGKVFKDDRGEHLHQIQRYLWKSGFNVKARDRIMVAQALGYAPKMRMQVQGFVPGVTLEDYAVSHDIRPMMPRIGRALAKLHRTRIPIQPPFPMPTWTVAHERESLHGTLERLEELCPEQMTTILPIYDSLIDKAHGLPTVKGYAPLHRDFYYSQVLIDGIDVYLIDFDLFAWGDPALDVANYVAHQHLLGLLQHNDWTAYTQASDLFLTSYLTDNPQPTAIFQQQFEWYKAATIFRLLTVVQTRPNMQAHFETLLQQAQLACYVPLIAVT